MIRRILSSEPVLIIGLLEAALALAAAFGLDLSAEQTAGLVAFAAALLAFVARSQVTPAAKVSDVARDAANAVARDVTDATAGPVGQVTKDGVEIVNRAVETATGPIGITTRPHCCR